MNKNYEILESCLSSDSAEVVSGQGGNVIPQKKEQSLLRQYLGKFNDPLIIILCVILVLSSGVTAYEIGQTHNLRLLFEPAGILMAIVLSTGLGFIFEVRANNEFKLLSKVKDDRQVKVIRRKAQKTKPHLMVIRRSDVVVGDLVRLESGDEVPADGHIVSSEAVSVDESAYTGEPYTVKSIGSDDAGEEAYGKDFLLRGSIILEGSCYIKVTAVGADTEEGKGAVMLQEEAESQTPLNRQLDDLSSILTKASYIMAALIVVGRLLYFFLTGGMDTALGFIEYLLNSIMIAVTLIVVAVPEGLPMSVTVSLALSMRRMLKEKNLVRKLHACETMGATTVICTDKTGTLTQNRMTVVASSFTCDRSMVAASVAVNSTAELSEEEGSSWKGIGNPTEVALLGWIRGDGFDYSEIRTAWNVISREAFTTETKYMSTLATDAEGRKVKFIKGAPEIVMGMCRTAIDPSVQETLVSYQRKAMRTLGFAVQTGEGPVEFVGIVGIADPVRETVKEAIETCSGKAGVRVIMVTGDVAATAMEIGRQISLISEGDDDKVLTGSQFAGMTDDELKKILPKLKILSRARPDDKARLVGLLQDMGEVVAVTGDGTNDALALKKAQVGLSMGDGTARAKEVSDITIVDNSFSSINKAIMWGRSLYMNIRRFIIFQMTINVCACMVVLVGAFTGMDSPLTVTQMLWVNLIMDTFAAMALSSLPADRTVMNARPRDPKSHIIDRRMLRSIAISGTAFFLFLAGLWQLLWHTDISGVTELLSPASLREYVTGFFDMSRMHEHMSAYESGVFFTVFVALQFWNLFNVRYFRTGRSLLTDVLDMIRGKRRASDCFSNGFLLISAVIILGQALIVNVAGDFFDVAPLSMMDWILILAPTSLVLIIPDLVRSVRHILSVSR